MTLLQRLGVTQKIRNHTRTKIMRKGQLDVLRYQNRDAAAVF